MIVVIRYDMDGLPLRICYGKVLGYLEAFIYWDVVGKFEGLFLGA